MATLTYQERFKTYQGVFDEFTNRTLFELQSRGYFDEMETPLKIGKESNLFIAKKGDLKVVVKIYRVQNCDFRRMYHYIAQDKRYESLKKQRRQIIFSWVQREYKNLIKASKANVLVPKPLAYKNHIIVESMIGSPAPALKDAPPKDPQAFLKLLLKQMRTLYQKADLVHGDLSSFNILNDNEVPYLIDFSQATTTQSSQAIELLERDLKNIAYFFKKHNIDVNIQETFKKVTK